eukprot:TRINITY_DN46062_c0_g1_i1.p1 TRINITY_DN46062_c0_g1~~TRINITY_DN46062_c0_g1_i1.p1  ORF type:complete len:105 (-),score=15.34 TRINITY_DN46062_c0_g1_i1:552-866(-)
MCIRDSCPTDPTLRCRFGLIREGEAMIWKAVSVAIFSKCARQTALAAASMSYVSSTRTTTALDNTHASTIVDVQTGRSHLCLTGHSHPIEAPLPTSWVSSPWTW